MGDALGHQSAVLARRLRKLGNPKADDLAGLLEEWSLAFRTWNAVPPGEKERDLALQAYLPVLHQAQSLLALYGSS